MVERHSGRAGWLLFRANRPLGIAVLFLFTFLPTVSGQGYSPAKAVSQMTVADGLKVKLFASEPMVRQPSFVKCDDRGRLWTIQYLQYPNPAGLKRVKVDRWSRTVYDRIPKPPPHGPRGADRITILEDSDGDGTADLAKDFVNGLNLVTGVAFGHGGVFVLNAPYLLFYPDRNRDDVPDSDPDVMLTGFGMEDAQSMSNHLTWGPDGWLYGVNGSTTTCQIRGLEFQQGLWRFHPVSREFELFCEGGSNCYGVTFDQNGELYYSTNGGPFVHAVQGGYYFKSFGKHGPLHNPYAYHFFANLQCDQVPGGPPTGGTIYLGDAFPESYHGKFIAGNFLGHSCSSWSVEPQGSTVTASFDAKLLDANDTWFGPTDMCAGPDGSMFVCDFHDQRTAHPDPDANWDRANGRVYKIEAKQLKQVAPFDIREQSAEELVGLLSHPNHWFRDRARCELAFRQDPSVGPTLRAMATQRDDSQLALQGLWSYHVTRGLDDDLAIELLGHPNPYVRFWTVRLLGDKGHASPEIAIQLSNLARSEHSPVVRAQLAASAKRFSGSLGLQIVKDLLEQFPNESDQRIPWLIWWAIESHAIHESESLVAMFRSGELFQNAAARDNAMRLIRRYAAEGSSLGYHACLQMLHCVPVEHLVAAHESLRLGLSERAVGLGPVEQGGLFQQQAAVDVSVSTKPARQFEPIADDLKQYIEQLWRRQPDDFLGLELAVRANHVDAYQHLISVAASVDENDLPTFTKVFALLALLGTPDSTTVARRRFEEARSDEAKLACLTILGKWKSDQIGDVLIRHYPGSSDNLRSRIIDVIFARPETALQLLMQIETGSVNASSIPVHQVRRIAVHQNSTLDLLVRKHWGSVGPGSSEQKLATMRRLSNDLRAGEGNLTNGKIVFTKHCGNCHQLHGEGNKVGPDLTTANRHDRAALLANIVDPSAVVRREYVSYIIQTDSGRVLTGLLAEQDAASVTVLDAQNKRMRIPRDEIEQLKASAVSLMPERILDELTPEQLRDLFRYLEQ